MTSTETVLSPSELSESVSDLVSLVKLLAEALSLVGSVPEVVRSIQKMAPSALAVPAQIATWREEIEPFLEELRSVREQRRQRALAAVSAARKDQATGLPGITSAQAELEKAISNKQPCVVVVLVFEQLRPLNMRFGRQFGDEVLASTAADLTGLLGDFGQLFRWNGPAFLLVSSLGVDKQEALESRLHEIATSRIEKSIEVENRAIHLKITFSWHIQPLESSNDVIEVSHALDDVVATRTGTK